jgi:cytochrome b
MKRLIWPWPTRLFHWALVLYLGGAWILSEFEPLLDWHAALGYGVGGLLLFRWIWGVIGPRYSRFRDWPMGRDALRSFLANPFGPSRTAGHNPAASWVMMGILVVATLVVLTGVLAYGIQEGKGPLAALNDSWFRKMELFAETHEALTSLLMGLVALHLAGVAADRLLHPRMRTLRSIIDGYKRTDAPEARLAFWQKVLAVILLGTALLLPAAAMPGSSPLTRSVNAPVDYEKVAPLFAEECAACHTLYPPHLLPKASWRKLMGNLADHFGDDASLDEEDRQKILAFLERNAAEHSSREAAHYLGQSVRNAPKKDIIAMIQTPYWKERHQGIDPKIFDDPAVRSRANCKACHSRIETGRLQDD